MKKIFAVSIMIGLLLCAFGCTHKSQEKNNTTIMTTEKSTAVQPTEDIKFDITYYTTPQYRYYFVENGICLEYYRGEDLHATVPSEIDGHKVVMLGRDSFYQKKEMKSVKIPESVETIEGGAFYRCYSLERAFIHKGIKLISHNPYFRCVSLKEIKVDSENKNYCDIDGVLFTKDKKELVAYPEGKKLNIYIVPDGVKKIQEDAFGYHPEIQKVYIPRSVIEFPYQCLTAHDPKDITLIVEQDSPAMDYAIKNKLNYEIQK